ncbi:glycosyl transferase family 2 [Methanobrevibacter sp. 87.7]|uniref:glycosyltransferase family 2 protein n=1 Tax=Methanobrevibacter sp. 87.7 TaxID=387957 RepID=UPI000B5086B6|nr:glycosyltransferase family 2 protein [Methanobrevibacter sp. 87.7]OWT33405.1 glycosyl transferase family 2 [Methanobrevibacter sp. 87.7]
MDLSIIIVNYKTFEITKNAIDSVLKSRTNYNYDIYLVDNASNDGSFEKLKSYYSNENKINFILSDINGGFAYANNLALNKSSSDYVLLLNSDTLVKEDTLQLSMDYIKSHSDVGALGVKVLLSDNSLDKACRRSFPNPTNSFFRLFHIPVKNDDLNNYNLDNLDDNGIYEIDCLTGAFMLINFKDLDKIAYLDEDFFMYGEDIDLCYRIKEAGYKIIYYGKTSITHFKGSSSKKQKSKLVYEFYRAMYIFYHKHYTKKYNPLLNFIIYIGIAILCLVKLIINVFKHD